MVNGKSWPFFNVEPRRYRLRLLNGSNARFYSMWLQDGGGAFASLWQIGTDGGLLDDPVKIAYPNQFLLAPGERADVVVDFSAFAGRTLILSNGARAPFPKGAPPDPQTTGQIMQFRVQAASTGFVDDSYNPAAPAGALLRSAMVRLVNSANGTLAVTPDQKRQLVLREVATKGGPLEVLLNNTKWSGIKESTMMTSMTPVSGSTQLGRNYLTELPRVGSTEVWEIINLTMDAHPIHIHLLQFQIVNRQPYQANKYISAWIAAFPGGVEAPGDGPPLA